MPEEVIRAQLDKVMALILAGDYQEAKITLLALLMALDSMNGGN